MKHFYRSLECRVPSAGFTKKSVFTRRHSGHIGVPKQWNGGHVGVLNQSCGSWTLFLMQTLSFVPKNLYRCWPREWKHSTAISRMVVGKNVHVTIPKGNMGYDQYTAPHTAALEPSYLFCFPSAITDIYPWPLLPFFQISLKSSELKVMLHETIGNDDF